MTTLIFGAVLTAALLHAVWNAIAHAITDRLVGFALIGAAQAVCGAVLAVFAGLPAAAAWPYLLVSGLLHILYQGFLMLSFRLGDFGQVYPLARGIAPWAVALGAAAFLGESLSPMQLSGVLVVCAGLTALVFAGGRPGRAQLPALAAAVTTGLIIATYTVVDGFGVRSSHDPIAYTAWLMLLEGPFFLLAAAAVRRRALWSQVRPVLAVGVTGGVLSTLAYGLVLWAQTQGALAGIAALRETSVVFGAVIGWLFLNERFGRIRAVSAVVVTVGIVLLSL
ncbi:EamA-like transporter family protein [Murinocardiopsis flavida]|uniref:EamA-like transporter family protein n=1 Tax=Murinocardiopsis flavida TaxID=645275 RepID=A0A2P8DQX4_9ACTN|nr:DMT family transporter [Murinocardiopsis flavida]PSK99615.1 EamA-like transporter family protein [Murinocardiopsis flavida]